jgi:ABC-type amino acid transport substrate-binding protein
MYAKEKHKTSKGKCAMKKLLSVVVLMVFILSACGSPATPVSTSVSTSVPAPTETPMPLPTDTPTSLPPTPTITPFPTIVISNADGLLAEILSRGTIVISTDPDFQPQSFLNRAGERPIDTKCASDQLTSAELQGFDIDVSNQIGLRLGVEPCFVTPPFDSIVSGSWGDKWDISVGSLRINTDRANTLAFTSPYYYENGETGLGIAIDFNHSLSIKTLLAALNQIVSDMHNDGTLSALSMQWFGKDLTTK